MKDHYLGVTSKYSGASEAVVQEMQDPESYDVDMSTIFDKKLEDFYLYAIQKHCLNTTQLCTYSLQSVTDARVVDLCAYMNARRDGTTPPHDVQVTHWGATFFVDSEKFPGSGLPLISSLLEELQSQHSNYTDSTVRVKVDVDCIGKNIRYIFVFFVKRLSLRCLFLTPFFIYCAETFAVTNAVSGEVLQGSLTPQKVTHQVSI